MKFGVICVTLNQKVGVPSLPSLSLSFSLVGGW